MSYNYGNNYNTGYGAASGYTSGGYAATSGYSTGGYAATSGYSTGGYAAASGASGYASGSGYSASGYGNGSHVNGYSTSTYNSSPAHSATATTTSSYNNNTTSSYKAPSSTSAYQSQIERQIVDAKQPITYNTRETTTAGQWSGLWLNKQEVDSFRGPIAITEYKINEDSNPEVIRKRLDKVKYTQEVQVKYLQPGPGPKPGDIIIRERQSSVPAAPPVILRQEAKGASDPAPLVLRGRPPRAQQIPPIEVEIDGPPAPPLPRRVIVEKLSSLPAKPQNVIVEKWLPYTQQKRRVIYEKAHQQGVSQVRNLIIEWEAPEVEINKVCKNLGTIQADPEEYLRKYGHELKDDSELPDCGDAPQGQCGVGGSVRRATTGASATTDDLPELEGDIQALKLVNLEKYGLGAYRRYIQ